MKKYLVIPLMMLAMTGNAYSSNQAVDEMFEVMLMDEQFKGGFEAMLPMIDQMAATLRLDAEAKAELLDIYRTWFEQDIDHKKIMDEMKNLYADRFSTSEIAKLIEFYRTPVGQKFLKQSPELMKIGAQIGMVEAQEKQALLLERLTPFLAKHKAN